MDTFNESDNKFVPFLRSLGVETSIVKSFEWMLSNRDFAGVLQWLFNNLDHNNALSAREDCRYKELEKKGLLLSPDELKSSIVNIQEQYDGICLPGDKEAVEDIKLDINQMKERLNVLEKQQKSFDKLKKLNEMINEELQLETLKHNSAYRLCQEDENKLADQCMSLAQDVESLTDEVTDVIADKLEIYSSCHTDKDTAKKFFTFGPFESYRQSQSLFRSHFDLYSSKKFCKQQNDIATDEELRSVLVEAACLEKGLSDAAWAYIESKAELNGEHAKLRLVTNYKDVHPSQINTCLLEAQSATQLLEQEETILYQQLHTAVKQLIDMRTTMVEETSASYALAVRQQILNDLTQVLDTSTCALRLDRVVYTALRHELSTLEQFTQFAAQLKHYVVAESAAVCNRIESMNSIHTEHLSCTTKLQYSDKILEVLHLCLGSRSEINVHNLVADYNHLLENLNELKEQVDNEYRNREKAIMEFKSSTLPLKEYIWSGCTKRPLRFDPTVSSLSHTLSQQIEDVDKRIREAGNLFNSVKNSDKHHLRKLWQWFLTDQQKFLFVLKKYMN